MREQPVFYFLVIYATVFGSLIPTSDAFVIPSAASVSAKKPLESMHRRRRDMHPPDRKSDQKTVEETTALIGGCRGGTSLRSGLKNVEEKEEKEKSPAPYLSVIFPLLLIYVSNQWSRSSLYYLVNFSDSATPESAMNVALNFSEAQYGALASLAFTALFAIASLVAGTLADKSDRKLLSVSSCLAWVLMTFLTSTATGYDQVLFSRILMGLACAFTTPAAYTLISDTFPKEKQALASSVYGSGVYFGGALASLSILLDESFGWRGTLGVISLFGVGSAALSSLLLPADPTYRNKQIDTQTDAKKTAALTSKDETSFLEDAVDVLSDPRIRWLFLGSFFRFCSGLCIGVWGAPYFRLAFPDDAAAYSVTNAFIVGLCGVTSGVLGGIAADFFATNDKFGGDDPNAGRLLVPIAGSLLAIPAWWACTHSPSFETAMFALAVEYLVAECWFGPVVAVLQSSVRKGKGGLAQGMFSLTGAVGNLAPSILGVLYGNAVGAADYFNDGSDLAGLLGGAVCVGYSLSAVCFALSARAGIVNKETV